MTPLKKIVLFLVMSFLTPALTQAVTMKEALNKAAEYFVKQAVKIESGEKLHILEIINYNSKKNDLLGKRIETDMYFALERQLPDFGLYLGKEIGKSNELQMVGTYEPKGKITIIKLRVLRGSEVLAQTEVSYDTKTRRKSLVAVLDVESDLLTYDQRRILSEVFRTALDETNAFDMASSSDIDKMNPDDIQNATGCTRDTCATIIGEQLGVDRVISSSVLKMDDKLYYVTGKIMDIKDGSILVTTTVKHKGVIVDLDRSMRDLADKLTVDIAGVAPASPVIREPVEIAEAPPVEPEEEIQPVKPKIEEESSSNMIWQITAVSLALVSASQSLNAATEYNNLADENSSIKEEYETANSAEREELNSEFEDNQEKMTACKQNVQLYDGLTAVFVLWEGYLLWSWFSDSEELTMNEERIKPSIDVTYANNKPEPRLSIKYSF